MAKKSPFHKALLRDKGTFRGSGIHVSRDAANWVVPHSLVISADGLVLVQDEQGQMSLVLLELQSCHVQIYPSMNSAPNQAGRRRFGKKQDEIDVSDEPPVIFVRSYDNEKLYLKIASKNNFGNLLLALLAWQNMRPGGLAKKWFAQNKVWNATTSTSDPHELLVCRFKVYGPIPAKSKNINLVNGPKAPAYQLKFDNKTSASSENTGLQTSLPGDQVHEGWFYTMGVLKSNGMLNFITELDGTLLYSIDIKKVLSSEIREIHNSVCESSSILFVGHIKELRWNNVIRPTSALTFDTLTCCSQSLLTKDGRPIANNLRILIEFPLHIDLEDWYVGLNYFSKREYIGVFDQKSVMDAAPSKRVVDLENTIDQDAYLDSSKDETELNAETTLTGYLTPPTSELGHYTKEHFRVSKKLTIDIIEAKFDNVAHGAKPGGKIYAEVVMWGFPWARTAIVPHAHNPFWKEEFSVDLPILTQMVHIVIKRCTFSDASYLFADKVIGTVYLTPDILTQQLHTTSTMTTGLNGNGDGLSFPGLLNSVAASTPQNNIVRLSIYDFANLPVGKLLLTVDLKEYLILSPPSFRPLENMLMNCPMKQLIEFCNSTVMTSEFENVSFILLDIFQSLGIEDKWFKALMEVELVSVDKMTRKNYNKGGPNTSSNNVFNTLFRGSSIFTKSFEKYIFRIGQEYLEKVFGNFFEKITLELKNCEIDPRYVRLQVKAERKSGLASGDESDDEDSDEDYDSDEEREREQRVKDVIEENFKNLYDYAEEIWLMIYATSNDLPQQIKVQLKNFRTKIDLACDPDDKVTSLNCLSAFIFLRFFCPAILNPKLFYLTKNHQTGHAQRTLTLIAKILLNLANRQEFSVHKETHLVKMNKFLEKHQNEVFDYFDKITGRKNDFNEKVLELSHEVNRFDLGLSKDSTSSELPTTPYLIDKYLRLTELIHLLQLNTHARKQSLSLKLAPSASSASITTTLSSLTPSLTKKSSQTAIGSNGTTQGSIIGYHERESSRESNDEIHVNDERNVYQIGSLEFEKLEFLDLVGDNETEGFIKSLCRNNEEIFSFITSNITLKDLQKQSTNLINKINALSQVLENGEQCRNLQQDARLWEAFVNNVVERACLDTTKNTVVFYDSQFQDTMVPGQKKLTDTAISGLKLKFPVEARLLLSHSFSSSNSLGLVLKGNTKNPFRRWLKRDS